MKTVNRNRYSFVTYQEERERRRAMLARAHQNKNQIEEKLDSGVYGLSGFVVLRIRLAFARAAVRRAGRKVEDIIMQGFLFHQRKGW